MHTRLACNLHLLIHLKVDNLYLFVPILPYLSPFVIQNYLNTILFFLVYFKVSFYKNPCYEEIFLFPLRIGCLL